MVATGGEMKPRTQQRDPTGASAGPTCVALATELCVDFDMSPQVVSRAAITAIATTKPIRIHGIKQITPCPMHLQDALKKPVRILGKVTARKAILVHCRTSTSEKTETPN